MSVWPILPMTLIAIGTLIGVLVSYAKLKITAKVIKETHVLVNNNMAVQLKLTSVALRRLAAITKNPADEEAAAKAEALYDEHMAKQAKVDAGK